MTSSKNICVGGHNSLTRAIGVHKETAGSHAFFESPIKVLFEKNKNFFSVSHADFLRIP